MDVCLFKANFKSLLSEGFDAEEEAVPQPQVRHPFLWLQSSLQGGLGVGGAKEDREVTTLLLRKNAHSWKLLNPSSSKEHFNFK